MIVLYVKHKEYLVGARGIKPRIAGYKPVATNHITLLRSWSVICDLNA